MKVASVDLKERLNDGRCDREGRFVCGGLGPEGEGGRSCVHKLFQVGAHHRKPQELAQPSGSPKCPAVSPHCQQLSADFTLRELLPFNVAIANSTCFSPDGKRMYFADTPLGKVWAFDYDSSSGTASNQQVFCEGEFYPDGATVDSEGGLWSCRFGGGCVVRYDREGRITDTVRVPGAKNITCCALGGSDMKTLFITTASILVPEEEKEVQRCQNDHDHTALQADDSCAFLFLSDSLASGQCRSRISLQSGHTWSP